MTKVSFSVASVVVALVLVGSFALDRPHPALDGSGSELAQIRRTRALARSTKPREPELQGVNRSRSLAPDPVVEHERLAPSGLDRVDDGDARAEAELMAELQSLGLTDHERSLALAREGNVRFPATGAAPERARIVVKSLVGLRRFHEARDEARRMIAAYPRTPEALDVERHLLVYPLDKPSREQMQAQLQGDVEMRGDAEMRDDLEMRGDSAQ